MAITSDGVIAGFTIILAIAAIGTWREMNRTGRRQLRAYLGFSTRWISGVDDPERHGDYNQDLEVTANGFGVTGIFLNNHGQTPAHDVQFVGGLELIDVQGAEKTIRELLNAPWNTSGDGAKRLVHPRSGESLPTYYVFASREPCLEGSKDSLIYSFGRAQYRDIFGKKHEATFCNIYDSVFGALSGGPWRIAPFLNTST